MSGFVVWALSGVVLLASMGYAADQPPVKAKTLLNPGLFVESQFGMRVEQAVDGNIAKVVTTGAIFEIDKKAGTVTCHQRIAAERSVAVLRWPTQTLAGLRLQKHTSGMAYFTGGGSALRINGDSLLMVMPARSGKVTADLTFAPDYHAAFQGNHNFFDPQGGISFFEHAQVGTSQVVQADTGVRVSWDWRGGHVFWAGVSPPKPFDWEAARKLRVMIWSSSDPRYMYPSDLTIMRFRQFDEATVLYVHNELMWRHGQLDFVPENPVDFRRTMAVAKEHGLKTIVYASPHFLLKGTKQEPLAVHDPHKFVGNFSGANVEEYLRQATRIVKEFGAEGLYFDEMYHQASALACNYYLARKSRELVGEDGPLYLHSTTDVMGNGHFGPICPTLNAYFDVIYKGEGEFHERDLAYTRYVLSTYNTSNAIGVQIIDERYIPSPADIDFWVQRANLRFFALAYWYYSGDIDVIRNHYWPMITDGLRDRIEGTLLTPVGGFTLEGTPQPAAAAR